MPTLVLLTGLAVAIGATALIIPPLRKLALRLHWVDEPDGDRKLHREPIPTVGGVAISIGFVAACVFIYTFREQLSFDLPLPPVQIWIAAAMMVLVGVVDDVRGVGFRQKLFFQVLAAVVLIHGGYRIDLSGLEFLGGDAYILSLYSSALTIFWIVGVINAVNLLDGLDGLAAGVAMIGFAALAVIFGLEGEAGLIVPAVLIVGALAGFLYHNFNPATIFMGDSGSLLLGVFMAVYSLESQGHADPILGLVLPVVALGLPILDTNLSIVRRLASQRKIFAPDRDHIHHRLLLSYSPRVSVLILYGVAASFGLVAVLIKIVEPRMGYLLLSGTLVASAAGIYAMGYLTARPLLYGIGRRLFGDDEIQELASGTSSGRSSDRSSGISAGAGQDGRRRADTTKEDHESSLSVNTLLSKTAGSDTVSSGDGALGPAPSLLTSKTISDMLSESSVVVAADGLTEAELDNESVILDLNSGSYFGLNEVGARVFRMIKTPTSVGDVVSALTREYDVDPQRLQDDILGFLNMMRDKKLIDVNHGAAA